MTISEKARHQAEMFMVGLQALQVAIECDDPKRELLVRVKDLVVEGRALASTVTLHHEVRFTDDMLRAAVKAMEPDRIQGFSTPDRRKWPTKWGAPHYILDTWREPGEQEIWRGDSEEEFTERCRMEEFRVAINAALAVASPVIAEHEETKP